MRGWILAGLLLAALAAQAGEVHGVEVEARLRDYFFDAARRGDQAMLKEFVEAGFDLDVQDAKGYTALILAAYHGHGGAVEQLLEAGADPCVQDARGNTALMGAIFKGEVRIARRLIGAQCSVATPRALAAIRNSSRWACASESSGRASNSAGNTRSGRS